MCFERIRSEGFSICTMARIAVSKVGGNSDSEATLWCFSFAVELAFAVDLALAVEVAVAVWAGGAQQGAVERSGT